MALSYFVWSDQHLIRCSIDDRNCIQSALGDNWEGEYPWLSRSHGHGPQCLRWSLERSSSFERTKISHFSHAEKPHVWKHVARLTGAPVSTAATAVVSILVSDPLLVWWQKDKVLVGLAFLLTRGWSDHWFWEASISDGRLWSAHPPYDLPKRVTSYWAIQRMSRHSIVSRIYRLIAFWVSQNVEVEILVGDEYLRPVMPLFVTLQSIHLISPPTNYKFIPFLFLSASFFKTVSSDNRSFFCC